VKALSIMYHDVVDPGGAAASGFPGVWADRYKIDQGQFVEHLARIDAAVPDHLVGLVNSSVTWAGRRPLFLTFDDGGVSAYTKAAGLLEQHGWRGHFFITTDFIDQPHFLARDQIRELGRRGHVIGSHSCSHPARISGCSWQDLLREWGESVGILAEILGEPVTTASVPGGFYSRQVAEAASQCGIRFLFTSEPTKRTWTVDRCLVLGRYFIQSDTPAATAAAFATGRLLPCAKQAARWKLSKLVKGSSADAYFRLKGVLLGR
jgi:peptidoglycan/xylan/chitin deacetylase (PgdA/CDA1 family)